MKLIISLVLILTSAIAFGQNSAKASLVREVDEYVKTVNNAAGKFLNNKLSTAKRIKAIEPYDIIYNEGQIEQFRNIVLNDQEQPEIRAMALDKIYQLLPDDEGLVTLAIEWLGNSQAPKVLREEALQVMDNFSFSSMDVPDVYQKMLQDPEPEFRLFAFTKLIVHGDARAQQKLIEGLENPDSAFLPAPDAIGVLSMALKKEYYPVLNKVLQQTPDDATKLEAIRALGFYQEARGNLISISRNANEKEEFREAALGALYAGNKENITEYVFPILTDKSATLRLQIIGIQMAIDVRQSVSYRIKAKKADKFDLLIKKLSKDKSKLDLQQIAIKYIEYVRPKY
jgi:HEAT repeat protein